jgi:hypothetical protein
MQLFVFTHIEHFLFYEYPEEHGCRHDRHNMYRPSKVLLRVYCKLYNHVKIRSPLFNRHRISTQS